MRQAIELIVSGAAAEGIDADLVFEHLDDVDLRVYEAEHLDDLRRPEFARTVARAVRDAAEAGRCSCSACQARRSDANSQGAGA